MAKKEQIHGIIIIGGGIAAYTAALYTARADLKPIILCGIEPDQLSLTTLVENWPGFKDGIQGPELIQNTKKQAEKFGAKCIQEAAESFNIKKGYFEIKAGNETFKTRTLIIATGASAKKLSIPGENKYFGRGISTCAVCDAALYRNKNAIVVGGGDSAMEESLALYKFAKKVTIIHRRNEFRASKIMQDRIFKLKNKINIIRDSEVTEVLGNGKLVTGIKVKNLKTEKISEIKTDGVFLAIGHTPNTGIFKKKINLDKHGYIVTDKFSNTSIPGIYAAGDVQDPIFKQAITSAGAGCQAALQAEKYLEKRS